MPTTANSTHVIFNDGTTQTTAGFRSLIFSSSPTNVNRFTSPGTYTKPGGLRRIKVTVVGGGGGGSPTASGRFLGGGGGGGGGTVIAWIPGPDVPPSVPVVIGAGGGSPRALADAGEGGGTTTFGTLITVTGGSGGGVPYFRGGPGGVGSVSPTITTRLIINGGPGGQGGYGPTASANACGGGMGGASHLGGGGAGGYFENKEGGFFGGGGGGAFNHPGTWTVPPTVIPGSSGQQGIVIIEEFI